jgi:hypothetical protein
MLGVQVVSVCGFHVRVAVGEPFQDPRRRLDLGPWRLEDRARVGSGPGRECGSVVLVVGVFGGDLQALALGQLVGELAVPGGQVVDLPSCLLHVFFGAAGGGAALGCGSEFGFGGAKRRPGLIRVAAPQFGLGGDG